MIIDKSKKKRKNKIESGGVTCWKKNGKVPKKKNIKRNSIAQTGLNRKIKSKQQKNRGSAMIKIEK